MKRSPQQRRSLLSGAGSTGWTGRPWTLEQVRDLSEDELLGMHGVGPIAVKLLREARVEHGWTWGSGSG